MTSPLPLAPTRTSPPRVFEAVREVTPGVALCVGVTAGALALQAVERRVFGHVWLESLVLAIILGAAVRTAWALGPMWRSGVRFAAKTLLEIAVALLGASVSAAALVAVGAPLLAGVAAVVLLALAASFGLGRLLGLNPRMATLVACGNSICGNSAIAAVAPLIGADGDEVTASIAFTAVLGVVVVLGLPLLGVALHMSELQFGALAGLTVYAVPQVLAATSPMGAVAMQFGTLVKLVRVIMLAPVCFLLSLCFRSSGVGGVGAVAGEPREASQPPLTKLVPWFILGFVALLAARSLGWLPVGLQPALGAATTLLTIVAMAGLGLQTNIRTVAQAGAKVIATVVLSLLVLGILSFLLLLTIRLH